MNERDTELWEEAAKAPEAAGDSWASQVAFLQKFADLVRADEREIWARDADWCIQNHLEHLIPERIRARGNK